MEEAYDHVNWSLWLYMLREMVLVCTCIYHCISTARFLTLVNGTPKGFFKSSQGLRQGGSLSSLLFIFVMEALGKIISSIVEGGFISGFSVGEDTIGTLIMSHLIFADDTLIFCRVRIDQI